MLGVVPERFVVAPPGLGEMAQGAIGIAQVVVGLGQVGLQGDGCLAMRQGLGRAGRVRARTGRDWFARGQAWGRARRPGSSVRVPDPCRPARATRRPNWCGPSRRRVVTPARRRNAPAASSWRPRACKARPRLLRTPGSFSPSRIASRPQATACSKLAQGTMDLGQRGVEDGHVRAQGHGLADQLGGQPGSGPADGAARPGGEARRHGFDRGPGSTRTGEPRHPGRRPGEAGPLGRIRRARS